MIYDSTVGCDLSSQAVGVVQAQELAELAQLQMAKRKALEQRDAQMRQLDDLKARILAERLLSCNAIHTWGRYMANT